MSTLTEFFLAAKKNVVQIDTLELSHPSWTKSYFVVRNARKGFVGRLENSLDQFFQYVPMQVTNLGAKGDLDTGVSIVFGDLGETLPKELQRIRDDDAFNVKPSVIYRVYASDAPTVILEGPFRFVAKALGFNRNGCQFEARAPGLNYSTTGMLYTLERFPMLRGAL